MSVIENQLVESSRALVDLVVANIGSDQKLYDETVAVMYKDIHPISMRASSVAYYAYANHPHLVEPHLSDFLKVVQTCKVDGVKRTLLKILGDCMHLLTEDEFGELADLAFSWAEDPKQSIAVKAFSIDILEKVINTYPEVKPEVIAILESIIPEGSAGLKNKCRKLILKLNKKKF